MGDTLLIKATCARHAGTSAATLRDVTNIEQKAVGSVRNTSLYTPKEAHVDAWTI